jgi:hypothetical protein
MEPTIKPSASPVADENEKPKGSANILELAQRELMRHTWGTFINHPPSVAAGGKGTVVPGCECCRKIIYSDNQYLSHLAVDVLPQILTGICRMPIDTPKR